MRLTAELQRTICAFIRAGTFLHVAAEAAGVPAEVFAGWLERGTRPGAREPYRSFVAQVRQAAAQARASAEMGILREKPETWLRNGPGRERPARPGWTTTAQPVLAQDQRPTNLLLDPGMQRLLASLLRLLEPYPEARVAVAQSLAARAARPGWDRSAQAVTPLLPDAACQPPES
jgi:hypothetical protein